MHVLVLHVHAVVFFRMQGLRGPPGLPGGLGDEWPDRIVTLKVGC